MTVAFALTRLQQRMLAILLALAPFAAVILFASSLASDLIDHHERLTLLKLERSNYEALIDGAPAWKAQIGAFRSASAGTQLFYTGNSSAAAGPQLVAALANLVSAHGGALFHSSLETAQPDDAPGTLRANVAFEANISDTTKILHAIRASRPLIFPERLIIRRQDATQAAQGPTRLDVDLKVLAYGRTP